MVSSIQCVELIDLMNLDFNVDSQIREAIRIDLYKNSPAPNNSTRCPDTWPKINHSKSFIPCILYMLNVCITSTTYVWVFESNLAKQNNPSTFMFSTRSHFHVKIRKAVEKGKKRVTVTMDTRKTTNSGFNCVARWRMITSPLNIVQSWQN